MATLLLKYEVRTVIYFDVRREIRDESALIDMYTDKVQYHHDSHNGREIKRIPSNKKNNITPWSAATTTTTTANSDADGDNDDDDDDDDDAADIYIDRPPLPDGVHEYNDSAFLDMDSYNYKSNSNSN